MIRNSRTFDRALSLITLVAIVMASFPVFPRVAEAAPVAVLVEDFGTGADSATITGWEKHEAATIVREGQASGNEDVASPNGDRFAKISADSEDPANKEGYICREIDAEDYTSLTLSYYWNGDFDTETSPAGGGGPDLGIVEARNNGNGDANCGAEGGWDELQSHDLTQHDDDWNQVSNFDISDFDGTKFTIRFRNESSATNEWFRVDGIEIEGEEVGDAPTVSACTITNSVVTSDLTTWDLSETRATGHNEIEVDGLHIWTEGNTSTDKAAGYYTTDFPLSGLGNQTIADALDYEADFGIEPGLQLVIDFDNNGTTDGILVGESVYGNNWWLTNSSAQFVKDDAPNTGGGNGSNWFGTPDEWLEEFPTAQVKAIGYSLGSGVHGDGVIKSINLGCTEYTFAKDASSEVIIVSGDTSAGENLPGWMFNRDPGTDTPFVFDTEQASMPDGSLHVLPIGANASDKFIAENFINTPIADIQSISYDFMIGAGGEDTDEEQFYMNVYANFGVSDDLKFYDCRYNVVPTVGSTGGFTTVTFDPTEDYPVTQRGDSPFTCPASPADMDDLSPGSNVRVFALNVGDTSASDVGLDGYLDKVVTVIDEGDNVHTTTYNFEPEQTATVEICKFNEDEDRLDGWTLMLLGDDVETVNVPSTGTEVFSTNSLDGDYVFIANGSYIYRPGYTGSTTDAAYSMRTDGNDPIDPTGHPYDPWVRVNDFSSPYEGYLGITVDNALGTTDWGSIFNPLHEYALQYSGDGDPAGFKIVDNAYGDNTGSLTVDINEGYVDVTGRDGCVTFEDVPYGTYEIDEIMQDGWFNVSGLGEVTVDEEEETFNVVNTDEEPKSASSVQICKLDDEQNSLDGWTLMLLGDEVEDLEVPANNMAGVNSSSLEGGMSYLAHVSGTWLNDREPDNYVDAEYSTEDGWVTHMDGFTGYGENILELQVAENFMDWGAYNEDHEYTASFIPGTDGPVNFRIFDGNDPTPEAGWYADNSGSLDVTIEEGYAGVTGENGCVVFEDVPYGTYEIDEIMQDGWSNVSGLGEVVVDGEEEVFTVVNTDEPEQCVDDLDGDWADNVVSFDQGDRKDGSDVLLARSDSDDVLGESDWTTGGSTGFTSLGFGGSIVVSFETFVPNVDGNDISIHEATNGTYPAETALIEVSQTGEDDDWYEVGTSTNTGVSYFDFDSTGLAWIKYVRVTDTTNPAIHANDADGFDLDAVDATQTVCAEPEEPQMCSVTVVSDDTNMVEETEDNAVLSWAHAAWTAVIDGAEWIWGTYQVEDPTVDTTQTFVKEFEWSGGIASATLDIATDNSYVVTLNGVEVASSTDENNFQLGTQDTYDLSSYVEVGENTLEIEVLNKGVPGSTPTGNPAGLKYNLTVVSDETGEDCMFAPEADLEITRPETEDQVLSGEYTFEAEYTDADDNADPVQWAIRAGTCNSGSGTVAGNVDSFNTPYMWNGASFSSTIDMDDWDEGEYCFVVNPTEDGGENFRETRWFTLEHPEPTQCLIVSDTTTLVVDNNDFAVETWDEHNNWTHDIADATWIWDSFYVEDPEATTTRTFKETFTVTELGSSTLDIAADNTYTVYINGDLVVERLNANNYQTPDEYDVTSFIDEGENELEIIVTNIGTDDSIPKSNPAGLLFRLEIETDGGQCLSTTEPDDGEEEPRPTYEVFGFAWNDDNTNDVKDGEEGYLSSVAVEITNGSTTVATTTDTGGRYYFMVEPGTWTLSAAFSGWYLTYPNTATSTHQAVVVATTSGPYDFGLDENEAIDDDDGGSDRVTNNDDDNNDDDGNDGPDGQVAGTSTTFGVGGGIDIWEDLRNEIGSSKGGPFEAVLGATAEAQELDATTTIKIGGDDATPTEDDEENASAPWKDWLCDYLWLLPLLWIITSAIAYWRKESYEDPRPMLWTQIIFGVVGLLFLVGYFIWGVPCAWIPSAIVAIGAAAMTYYGKE